jgi:hypothetical protein
MRYKMSSPDCGSVVKRWSFLGHTTNGMERKRDQISICSYELPKGSSSQLSKTIRVDIYFCSQKIWLTLNLRISQESWNFEMANLNMCWTDDEQQWDELWKIVNQWQVGSKILHY